jgi:site-specific DNA-cytosine methylase
MILYLIITNRYLVNQGEKMTYTSIDCQSFAGGFTLGATLAGFEIIGKREATGGFGVPAVEGNKKLLGDFSIEAGAPDTWTPLKADLVFGNPPCSGFSNRSSMVRGLDENGEIQRVQYTGYAAAPNQCMWDLIEYAAKCDPEIVMFESVQGAYNKGRDLMQDLRNSLEMKTGSQYHLYHVLHDVAKLGGAQERKRYFWVAARIKFGVDPVEISPTTVKDRIGDLENVALGSMNGHQIEDTPRGRRVTELASKVEWKANEVSGDVYRRALDLGADLALWDDDLKSDKGITQFAPKRLNYDTPSNVLAGDALWRQVHPTLPRTLTHREVARLSGFPDDWDCEPYQDRKANAYWWGKGICIEAGKWISTAAYNAISGQPQAYQGELIGDRESFIDFSKTKKNG